MSGLGKQWRRIDGTYSSYCTFVRVRQLVLCIIIDFNSHICMLVLCLGRSVGMTGGSGSLPGNNGSFNMVLVSEDLSWLSDAAYCLGHGSVGEAGSRWPA